MPLAKVLRRRVARWASAPLFCALPMAGLLGWAAQVAAVAPVPAAVVSADSHLQAARRQAGDNQALKSTLRRACAPAAAPATASLAVQALQQIEAEHQRERVQARPDLTRLLNSVVLRECLAYHATRLQIGASYPVWWHTHLTIESVRPAQTGFEAQARITTAHGAATSSRITFSRGLHHACFVQTDSVAQAACVLLDTHPHGDRVNGWAEAHEGPLVATYAGHVSATAVVLPAIATREIPVFSSFPSWQVPTRP